MRVTWNDLLFPGDASDFFGCTPLPPFDPTARGYSAANAWWLAELSRIVYRRERPEITSPLEPCRSVLIRGAGLEEIGFARSDETGSAALIVRGSHPAPFAVLAFRGTEQEIQDFICDADTLPIPAFGGSARVHKGFKRALNSIWTPLEPSSNTELTRTRPPGSERYGSEYMRDQLAPNDDSLRIPTPKYVVCRP